MSLKLSLFVIRGPILSLQDIWVSLFWLSRIGNILWAVQYLHWNIQQYILSKTQTMNIYMCQNGIWKIVFSTVLPKTIKKIFFKTSKTFFVTFLNYIFQNPAGT